jgi:hypothetical protein
VPTRIQLSRRKGWRLPENTVVVSRPSVFGNPFKWQLAREAGYQGTELQLREFSVQVFREWVTNNARYGHGQEKQLEELLKRLPELRGKNLACWCPPGRTCHADVLIELANR